MPSNNFKFESRLAGQTADEIARLADEGREIFYRTGVVPENSPQALAIAALVRLEKETKKNNWGRDRDHRKQDLDEEQAA